ncbi:aldehyde dehydrogenase family protein [Halobacillus amylolyticus]|uniref:Aldehyde dehydrogenase family protein n=1 Tax=Halobacillus amylolyticus TaxID=2932259 RepID=A0ABY4HG20_9BACI|nr:aldehyde dehydrogenase family protein [Halobacillus amylolyticus]UOR12380.1 aldehyde dehydrogenase family protein [Halobacillus amylolyticus]
MDQVSWNDTIMWDEAFDPLLPILTFNTLAEVIEQVNRHPKPLALYYFGENDTLYHILSPIFPLAELGKVEWQLSRESQL